MRSVGSSKAELVEVGLRMQKSMVCSWYLLCLMVESSSQEMLHAFEPCSCRVELPKDGYQKLLHGPASTDLPFEVQSLPSTVPWATNTASVFAVKVINWYCA
jgi:hypothetical protein